MDFLVLCGEIMLIALILGAFFCALYRVVIWSKTRSRGAYVLGALVMPLSLGNVQDPDFKLVEEAKQLKKHEEDNTGDPSHDRKNDSFRAAIHGTERRIL